MSNRAEILKNTEALKNTANTTNKANDKRKNKINENDTKDQTSFLVTVLKILAGIGAVLALLFTLYKNLTKKVNDKRKELLKKKYERLPASSKLLSDTCLNEPNGLRVPISNIDYFNIFLYEGLESEPPVVKKIRECLETGIPQMITDSLEVSYDETEEFFTIKSVNNLNNTVNTLIDTEIIPSIDMSGNLSFESIIRDLFSNNNKSSEDIKNKIEAEKIIEKIYEQDTVDFVNFNFENLFIELERANFSKGFVLDNNCNITSYTIEENFLKSIIENDIESINIDSFTEVLNDLESYSDLPNESNKKDYLYTNLFDKLKTNVVINSFVSPDYLLFKNILDTLNTSSCEAIQQDDIKSLLSDKFIICMIDFIKETIYEEILIIITPIVLRLGKEIVRKLLKEKVNNYTKTISGLST
jgi:hypothetical protein